MMPRPPGESQADTSSHDSAITSSMYSDDEIVEAVRQLRHKIDSLKIRITNIEAGRKSLVREHLIRRGLDPDVIDDLGDSAFLNQWWWEQDPEKRGKEAFTLYNLALIEIGFHWVDKFEWTPGHWTREKDKEAGGHE